MVSYGLGIITCPLLRMLLIKVVSQHAKEKEDVFQKGVMQAALEEMHEDNDPKKLANKMTSCFLFFGLHRRSEILET